MIPGIIFGLEGEGLNWRENLQVCKVDVYVLSPSSAEQHYALYARSGMKPLSPGWFRVLEPALAEVVATSEDATTLPRQVVYGEYAFFFILFNKDVYR